MRDDEGGNFASPNSVHQRHKVLTLEIKPTADFFDGINVRQTARDDELLKDFALIR